MHVIKLVFQFSKNSTILKQVGDYLSLCFKYFDTVNLAEHIQVFFFNF